MKLVSVDTGVQLRRKPGEPLDETSSEGVRSRQKKNSDGSSRDDGEGFSRPGAEKPAHCESRTGSEILESRSKRKERVRRKRNQNFKPRTALSKLSVSAEGAATAGKRKRRLWESCKSD